MRERRASDYQVTVDGIGVFTFAQRTLRDDIAVAAEYSRLTEGVETPTDWLAYMSGCIAALKVLTVEAPDGWDLEEIDPLSDDGYASIMRVHTAMRSAEARFRGQPKASGQGNGGDAGVLVQEEVQPDAQ